MFISYKVQNCTVRLTSYGLVLLSIVLLASVRHLVLISVLFDYAFWLINYSIWQLILLFMIKLPTLCIDLLSTFLLLSDSTMNVRSDFFTQFIHRIEAVLIYLSFEEPFIDSYWSMSKKKLKWRPKVFVSFVVDIKHAFTFLDNALF